MMTMFEAVQQEFMRLSVLLSKIDFDESLTDMARLAQVNDALTDTYVLLNQGFCENATMCKKCVDNRDQLRNLSQLIDMCEENENVTEEAFLALKNFALSIPEILMKMESVYIEKLQDVQA
jgi:hypothetical protein